MLMLIFMCLKILYKIFSKYVCLILLCIDLLITDQEMEGTVLKGEDCSGSSGSVRCDMTQVGRPLSRILLRAPQDRLCLQHVFM